MHDKMVNSSHAKNSCGKRKCVVLSLQSKIAIPDDLKAGAKQEKLAGEYRIRRSTVGDIKKNEDKIRLFGSTMESMAKRKKG